MRLLLILPALFLGSLYSSGSWSIGEDYAVKFATSGAVGTFQGLVGNISFAEDELAQASFDVWVATSTIATGNKTKDKHARGAKWLDADQFPKISFKSTSFQKTAEGYQVQGNLSIHGITKVVSIPFTFVNQVFSGSLTVARQDYDIKGPFLFGGLVGDEIEVTLNIPVQPAK